mmetsp:Transcript_111738/g.316048  ORF Transcript_111738/g.316048 Transcript_111738/m.316048 type:complete len:244 (-) Transcript_111738:1239-1970(-)
MCRMPRRLRAVLLEVFMARCFRTWAAFPLREQARAVPAMTSAAQGSSVLARHHLSTPWRRQVAPKHRRHWSLPERDSGQSMRRCWASHTIQLLPTTAVHLLPVPRPPKASVLAEWPQRRQRTPGRPRNAQWPRPRPGQRSGAQQLRPCAGYCCLPGAPLRTPSRPWAPGRTTGARGATGQMTTHLLPARSLALVARRRPRTARRRRLRPRRSPTRRPCPREPTAGSIRQRPTAEPTRRTTRTL